MKPSTTIIGIAGASGAGKSSFAAHLHDRLRQEYSQDDIQILNEDRYYRDRSDLSFEQRCRINYDHPDSLEHALLIRHLEDLRAGRSVSVPQYDYSQHNRRAEAEWMPASRVLILEGILILHQPQIRELMDLRIFVDVALDVCLIRRLRRDTQHRGRALDSVLAQYEDTVRPMFFEFVEPSRKYADLIVPRGGANENALSVLHSHLVRVQS